MMEFESAGVDLNDIDIKIEVEEEDDNYSNYSSSSSPWTTEQDPVQVKVEDSSAEFEIDNFSSSEAADQEDEDQTTEDKLSFDSSIPGVLLTYPIIKCFSTFCEVQVPVPGGLAHGGGKKPTKTRRRRVSYYKYFTSTVDKKRGNKVLFNTCKRCGEDVVATTPSVLSLRQHLSICQVSREVLAAATDALYNQSRYTVKNEEEEEDNDEFPAILLTHPIQKYFSAHCEVLQVQVVQSTQIHHRVRRISYYDYFTCTRDTTKLNKVVSRTCRRCGEVPVVTDPRNSRISLRQHLRTCQVSEAAAVALLEITCAEWRERKKNQPIPGPSRTTRSQGSPPAIVLDSLATAEQSALEKQLRAKAVAVRQNQKLGRQSDETNEEHGVRPLRPTRLKRCTKKKARPRRSIYSTKASRDAKLKRRNETPQQRMVRLERQARCAKRRYGEWKQAQDPETKAAKFAGLNARWAHYLLTETPQQHMERLARRAEAARLKRLNETPEEREIRLAKARERRNKRQQGKADLADEEEEQQVFSCNLCSSNVSFGAEFLLEMHKKQVHTTSLGGDERVGITCGICKAKCKDVATLNKHTTKSHPTL